MTTLTTKPLFAALLATFLSGCSSLLSTHSTLLEPEPLLPRSDQPLSGATGDVALPSTLDQFITAAKTSYAANAHPADFNFYVSKGVNLSNQQCDEWLNMLSHQNTELELGTGLFNIGSNTLVSVLGLAQASANAVAGVGLASAAVNAIGQNYRAAVLFTPDFATLHQKITAARQTAAQLMLQTSYSSFDNATRDLVTFDKMCSRDSVQLLLEQSLASSQYQIPSLAQPPAQAVKPVTPPPPPTQPAPGTNAPLLQNLPPAQVITH